MQRTDQVTLGPVVRKLLAVDTAFEAVVGLLLLGVLTRPERWLDLSGSVLVVAAVVFFAAAIALAVAAVSRSTSRSFVRQLAWANIAGGAILWAWLFLGWGRFEPEGRWLVAAAADCFIVLGALEWIALERTGGTAA